MGTPIEEFTNWMVNCGTEGGGIACAVEGLTANTVKLDSAKNRMSASAEVLLMVRILAHAAMVK